MHGFSVFPRSKLVAAGCAILIASCGDDDPFHESNPSLPVPGSEYGQVQRKVHAKLSVSGSSAIVDNNASIELDRIVRCSRNVDTGRLDLAFAQVSGKAELRASIKDFSSSPKTYACKQAVDNQRSKKGVGGKFETCAVAVEVVSGPGESTKNAYSMHREQQGEPAFAYAGNCNIIISAVSPMLVGKIECADLVQTQFDGMARNPVDAAVNADIASEFSCDLD